jgi:uncharacterized membrane-anchored protein YitT (DUF2179 family)
MLIRRQLANYAFCTLGALALAVAIAVFLSPNHIAAGGPPGIAILLFHVLGISKGMTLVVLNGILLAFAAGRFGSGYLLRTAYAILATAVFTELIGTLWGQPGVTASPLLNALYGGVLAGAGIGLVFKGEAASSGWSFLMRRIARRLDVGVGQCLFALDSLVIALSAIAFRDIESALWAGIGLYVTGWMVDRVLTGQSGNKMVSISTRHAAALSAGFARRLGEAGGAVQCHTLAERGDRQLLWLMVDNGQLGLLGEVVREHDPAADVSVLDAVEFHGGGRRNS